MAERFRWLINPRFDRRAPYPEEAREVVRAAALEQARRSIEAWPEYARTPLVTLDDIAQRCDVGEVLLKDESRRFGLGSFKAIGAAYGAMRALQAELAARYGAEVDDAGLRAGAWRRRAHEVVLACATHGNHGAAVAWAARAFGCRCEVYVPRIVSAPRRARIEALGARVTRVDGTYDDAVRALAAAAAAHGWLVVSDQAYEGYEEIPRDIMQGYALVAEEALAQLGGRGAPSHVFVQAGVGGFAGAVCAHLWERFGAQRPVSICVEPLAADCLYRSAQQGRPARVPGDLDTVMGCLSCGEPSTLGWRILSAGAGAFLAIDDAAAVDAMKLLAFPSSGRQPLVVGESGAAGLAGLLRAAAAPEARTALELGPDARVLLFATEGAADPQAYASLVGASPEEVLGLPGPGGLTRG